MSCSMVSWGAKENFIWDYGFEWELNFLSKEEDEFLECLAEYFGLLLDLA